MGLGEGNITQRNETVRTIPHSFTFTGLFGAFAKLRRETISFVMSVCLSVRQSVSQSVCPYGTTRLTSNGLSWNFIYVEKLLRKIKFH